ncbi:MAG: hypothetical protein J5982_05875 [Bacilli bacterium]|nr:hypothetical protein [Bacilli bacterium]
MFSNFSSFLSSSLRILNIANRAIPLVRDITPTIRSIRSKISNTNLPKLNSFSINNNQNVMKREIPQKHNNSLTFFR